MTIPRKSHVEPKGYHLSWEENFRQGGGWIMICLLTSIFSIFIWSLFIRDPNHIKGILVPNDSWKLTTGRIIHSSVVHYRHGPKTGDTVAAEVQYKYQVDGKWYYGRRISFGSTIFSDELLSLAENIVNKYPAGSSVNVFYLPNEPTLCVLNPNEKEYGNIALCLTISILCLFGIVFGIKGTYKYWWLPRYKK